MIIMFRLHLALALSMLWAGSTAQNSGDFQVGYANYKCRFGSYPMASYSFYYSFVGWSPALRQSFVDILNFQIGLPIGPLRADGTLIDPIAQYTVHNVSQVNLVISDADPPSFNLATLLRTHDEDPPLDNITTYIFDSAGTPRVPEVRGTRYFLNTDGCDATIYPPVVRGHAKLIGYDGDGSQRGSLNGPVDFRGPFVCKPKAKEILTTVRGVGPCQTAAPVYGR